MNFGSHYYFEQINRLSYWIWRSPNSAGASLATLAPLFWVDKARGKVTKHFYVLRSATSLCLEFLTYGLVLLTFSRGAFVALISGLFFYVWVLIVTRAQEKRKMVALQFAISRLVFIISVSGLLQLGKRFQAISRDASVLHRFALWKGALQLIAARPFFGWGFGESGIAYAQWIQPPNLTFHSHGLVNSYLEITADLGLPALFAFCSIAFVPIALSFRRGGNDMLNRWQAAFGASICSYLTASFFSTFSYEPRVIFIPLAISAASLILYSRKPDSLRITKACTRSCMISFLFTCFIGILSYAYSASCDWQISCKKIGIVSIERKCFMKSGKNLNIATNLETFGDFYGKTLRNAIQTELAINRVTFLIDDIADPASLTGTTILVGEKCRFSTQMSRSSSIVLVAPSGSLPNRPFPHISLVIYPGTDDWFGRDWIRNASAMGALEICIPWAGSNMAPFAHQIIEASIHAPGKHVPL